MKNNQKGNGQYWYGIGMMTLFLAAFAFLCYLGYQLIIKASNKEFQNTTILQTLITLVFTVVIGTVISKSLEARNAKRLETYKVQKEIALTIINLAGVILTEKEEEEKQTAKTLLNNENVKVKLFYNDETCIAVKDFLENSSYNTYETMTDLLKKNFR
jgi:hypothetical protein